MPKLSLNASRKTKHTPAGEIPVDWGCVRLSEIARVVTGATPKGGDLDAYGGDIPFITPGDINEIAHVDKTQRTLTPNGLKSSREIPEGSTVVVCIGSSIGKCGVTRRLAGANQQINAATAKREVLPGYLFYSIFRSMQKMKLFAGNQAVPIINKSDFSAIPIPIPHLGEQRKIANILSTWDTALENLDALIRAKQQQKKALMQQLLTGKRRLPGFDNSSDTRVCERFGSFPSDWRRITLGRILIESTTRNSDQRQLPVLSSTKHYGLVLSDDYFGRKVYADDLGNYKVVKRGQFAYATNHIEEGSIGLQNICDEGLVSPIYTVFSAKEGINTNYLFRLLKSPLLIHLYQINTSASVDRRGSLRFKEFAKINIWLPNFDEQNAINAVLDSFEREIVLLSEQRKMIDQQKRGLMQKLLTGKLRVR